MRFNFKASNTIENVSEHSSIDSPRRMRTKLLNFTTLYNVSIKISP